MMCEEMLKARKLPVIWDKDQTDWESRRREITELFQREIFGYRPEEPECLEFTELPDESYYGKFCAGKAIRKKIRISGRLRGREFHFPMDAVIPKHKEKLPFFVHINFRPDVPDQYMPTEELTDLGFAVFSFGYKDVTDDNDDFSHGLAGTVFDGRERSGSDCGKIALWSWAASRVMDYCQTLSCLDFEKSAVIGHSRLGKTALVTGMLDERFRFVISNDSGCAGAALSRGKTGESLEAICERFPHWFAPDYLNYAGKEQELPLDQHFLVAASAPRYVCVGSAEEDLWADPVSEYLSCCAASSVYEQLNLPGFVHPDRLPNAGDVLHEGSIGYHIRHGCHFLSREDWNYYCRFIRSKC